MNVSSKRSVVLVQVNFQYGNNVFVPYSVGSIQAFAQTVPAVAENFQFHKPLFRRDDPVKVANEMERPAVVGFSCYLWNWEYNKYLAQEIRMKYPETLIVFGGTHVPDISEGFFKEHPYVDILVHQEGEFSFADILVESISATPDYTKIPGLSVRVEGNRTHKTNVRGRISDLTQLPSPYLAGIFDFMLDGDYVLNVSQETTRGCPYLCTFCDWGGSTYSKVYVTPEDRLMAEFNWFGMHKVEYLFNCDANYGIMPRDVELTRKMIEVRSRHGGFPKRFRMCTAKNSNDKIFDIVMLLDGAGMNKGATLSFQSMDEHTLGVVKRSNIKMGKFSDLMNRYKATGIATYTELIMGLPGETYESSKTGIDVLLNEQADSVNIYVYTCTMLPNSEMSKPEYVAEHGIKSVRMPVLLAHSTPEPESISEYVNTVIETATMPNRDWQKAYLFYWAVQAFHCLGLTRDIAIVFHKEFGVSYSDFYEKLIDHFASNQTLVGVEIAKTRNIVVLAMGGGRLDVVMPEFGDIYWPLEEASFLRFVTNKEQFYREIKTFLISLGQDLGLEVQTDLVDDLVAYQSAIMIDPYTTECSVNLQYNLHEYFGRRGDSESVLTRSSSKLTVHGHVDFAGDKEKYAREVVWYGRKGGQFQHTNVTVE